MHLQPGSEISYGTAIDNIRISGIRTGIESQYEKQTIKVFPNPSDGRFLLMINSSNGSKVKLKVLDIDGRTVISKDLYIRSNQHSEQINLDAYSDGIYILLIDSADKRSSIKLLKKLSKQIIIK